MGRRVPVSRRGRGDVPRFTLATIDRDHRENDTMKKAFLAASAATLLFGATIAPVMAQDAAGDNADANRVTTADIRDDDGFDWGLLGLLGLLGLIPRKQRTVVHHDTVRTDSTGTTR
jgi:hypothetical protein